MNDEDDQRNRLHRRVPKRDAVPTSNWRNKVMMQMIVNHISNPRRPHQLVDDCFKRMADDRAALLKRLRAGGQQAVREGLSDLVQQVCAASTPPKPATPAAPTPAVPATPALSPNEYESLMLQLEARFYSDDWREEADAVGAWERAEADSIAQAWLDTKQAQGPNDCTVWCPVCQRAWVEESRGVLLCACRRLQLDRRTEGLGLQHLRQRLDAVLTVHRVGGCAASPLFGMEPNGLLCMRCAACGAMDVVM